MAAPTSISEYIQRKPEWTEALTMLHELCLDTGLEAAIKWGAPVYSFGGKNVVGLGGFKSYVGIWFFQGGLLEDPHGLLRNAQEGKTRAMRQMRFGSIDDIDRQVVRGYIAESIENFRTGREIKPDRRVKAIQLPIELKQTLDTDDKLKSAFELLSPACRREYAEYVGEAKRETTRWNRLLKIKPMILEGKGLNDKYRR